MYDISGIESLIARHAPKLMKQGLSSGTGAIREEARPKSTPKAPTKYRLISPAMGEEIIAMNAEGMGNTEIGAHFRISPEAVRTHLRKNGIGPDAARLKKARSSEYSNVILTKTR